ncbi:rCG58727 [Rattus norvegicus]|uniref:RCG58727 n=1 Tax=Rattus norvegicus TaxID=10116 RepID=A6JLL3_RAT|nr:rCG58727 [Rattus norvegicus]
MYICVSLKRAISICQCTREKERDDSSQCMSDNHKTHLRQRHRGVMCEPSCGNSGTCADKTNWPHGLGLA